VEPGWPLHERDPTLLSYDAEIFLFILRGEVELFTKDRGRPVRQHRRAAMRCILVPMHLTGTLAHDDFADVLSYPV